MKKEQTENTKLKVPKVYDNLDKWETNRRSFLRAALVAGAASQLAWFTSCSAELEKANDYLTAEQSTILKRTLEILWPDDENGPSVDDLNTFGYFMWFFSTELLPQEEKDFIVDGMDFIEAKSKEIYKKSFFELSSKRQEVLIANIVDMNDGEKLMAVMITYILESLILDPIYGGNKDEAGWKWLNHVPGNPRPDEGTRVEAFYEKYKPNA